MFSPVTDRTPKPSSNVRARTLALGLVLGVAALLSNSDAQAGCGCDKAPPLPAQVRPSVTYAGMPVTLFSASFIEGQSYVATFTSGITGEAVTGEGVGEVRRDLADAVGRPQINVTLPALPLGPTSIRVIDPTSGSELLAIEDADFTVAPAPVVLPAEYGSWRYPAFRAAVGRDGVAYVALDLTDLTQPLIFEAQAQGYPLRFGREDAAFYNAQGFLMQLLVQGDTEPVPGMFVLPAANPATDSDVLHYSRHEFATYFLQHEERKAHAIDSADPNWHLDGSPHIDHDHLILAIVGTLGDGSIPAAGATPPFDLVLQTNSLFHTGLVGDAAVTISGGNSVVDGYNSRGEAVAAGGDVASNGKVTVSGGAFVDGTVTAAEVTLSGGSIATGGTTRLTAPMEFMSVDVPAGLVDLGKLQVSKTVVLQRGSYRATEVVLKDSKATLVIDNSEGPVTLYVTGKVDAKGTFATVDPDPEKFALYVAGRNVVTINSESNFYGVIYAPTAEIKVQGGGDLAGAFVGKKVTVSGGSSVHYDTALRGDGLGK